MPASAQAPITEDVSWQSASQKADPLRRPFPSSMSFASLTLAARYELPPESGWLAIMMRRCASCAHEELKLSTVHLSDTRGMHSTQLRYDQEQGKVASAQAARRRTLILSSGALSLRPSICAASLRFISDWKPPCYEVAR